MIRRRDDPLCSEVFDRWTTRDSCLAIASRTRMFDGSSRWLVSNEKECIIYLHVFSRWMLAQMMKDANHSLDFARQLQQCKNDLENQHSAQFIVKQRRSWIEKKDLRQKSVSLSFFSNVFTVIYQFLWFKCLSFCHFLFDRSSIRDVFKSHRLAQRRERGKKDERLTSPGTVSRLLTYRDQA